MLNIASSNTIDRSCILWDDEIFGRHAPLSRGWRIGTKPAYRPNYSVEVRVLPLQLINPKGEIRYRKRLSQKFGILISRKDAKAQNVESLCLHSFAA